MSAMKKKQVWVPQEITEEFLAFPASVEALMPDRQDIPEEFSFQGVMNGGGTKWNKIVSEWFFKGLPKDTEFKPKDGIDAAMAIRHIGAIMHSFIPKHQHKEEACAYLLSLWFEDIVLPAPHRAQDAEF